MEKRLFTKKEAAQYLNIGITKLYYLVKEGKLKGIKLDRKLLFDIQDLNEFIDNLKQNQREKKTK